MEVVTPQKAKGNAAGSRSMSGRSDPMRKELFQSSKLWKSRKGEGHAKKDKKQT